jgi:hypothetical protein
VISLDPPPWTRPPDGVLPDGAPADEVPADEVLPDGALADGVLPDDAPADGGPAQRTPAPMCLSAPVPEMPEPDEPTARHPSDGRLEALMPEVPALEAVAARGKPPAPPAGQPTELAHEAVPAGRPGPTPGTGAAEVQAAADGPGHPATDAEAGVTQETDPGTNGTPARFERVRSTPTPPGG